MLPQPVLYYGKDEPLPERIPLRAGPLTLFYEQGDLRGIKLGDKEILRRVYVAIRDRNWSTILPRFSNIEMDIGQASFHVEYDVENNEREIDFLWHGTITGEADGTITLNMNGVARSTFLRNRIGFCVLHPIRECAGQPCVIEKTGGTLEPSVFPTYISPHQPFLDMRAISHEVMPGVRAEVRFVGDVFETEDQRNWTDTSYKTYSTPLSLPFPVEIAEGTRIVQTVTLRLKGNVPPTSVQAYPATVNLTIGSLPLGRLPRLGLSVASHGQSHSPRELARLNALNLAHLRVDLKLSRPDYESALRRAVAEANALGVSLEVALFLSNAAEDELKALVRLLEEIRPPVCHWLVFHNEEKCTTEPWVKLARQLLGAYNPAAKIGAGSNAYFTEVNRSRPPAHALDLVCYSLNPQVHAVDNTSLMENLEGQGWTVKSARQFAGDVPIAVTPVTLKSRFNPNAAGAPLESALEILPSQVDVRQMSLFGAAWTLGSIKHLAENGAYSVTYYETTGWRGVMETEHGSPEPELFHSLAGSVFPLYHVLADVGEFEGGEVLGIQSSDTLRVDALALCKQDRMRIILANMTAEAQRVTVGRLSGRVRVRLLDETNVMEAMQSPEVFRARPGEHVQTYGMLELDLLPYAVASINGSTLMEDER